MCTHATPVMQRLLKVTLVLLGVFVCAADAATIVADGSTCTLIDAINAANTNAAVGGCNAGDDRDTGGDIIDLRTDVTLTTVNNLDAAGFGNGLPGVNGTLTINGGGHTIARSAAESTPPFRLVDATGGTLSLNDLVLRNGYLEGTSDSQGPAVRGGGIVGNVTLTNCVVSENRAQGGGRVTGGGISGVAMLINSTVSGNSAVGECGGGFGGGLEGTVTLFNSAIVGNYAGGSRCNSGSGAGGGIFGSATITNSTIAGNTANVGGGISGNVSLTNSTVSGNQVSNGYPWGSANAGGISGGVVVLTNSTVSDNTASQYANFSESAGVAADTLAVRDSIISGNTLIQREPESMSDGDCSSAGPVAYSGLNLISDGSCGAAASGQLTGDPKLGPLADNGGPTQTHALLPGSPAIDRIDFIPGKGCTDSGVTTDQRGTTRPQPAGGKCDIGAFELAPNTPKLALSKQPDRSSPVSLEGRLLVGNAYIFTTPDTGVFQVEFRLDGAYIRTEKYTPFDFASTAADGSAAPLSTAGVTAGAHSVSARFKMADGTVRNAGASFSIPGLYISPWTDRSSPVPLNGQHVPAANLYIFAGPENGLKRVQFWLDGRWVKTENLPAFDFAGTAGDGTAHAFDGRILTPGSHVIKALLTLTDGSTSKIGATFERK